MVLKRYQMRLIPSFVHLTLKKKNFTPFGPGPKNFNGILENFRSFFE